MGTEATKPTGADNVTVDFGPLTVPVQQLEAMVNWRMIHGTPAEGSRYISIDPVRLAEIAGTTARFPLRIEEPAHAIFLEEGMQRFRDALGAWDVDIQSVRQLEDDWEMFWAESEAIPQGMKEAVRQATLEIYRHLQPRLAGDGHATKAHEGMMKAAALTKVAETIELNEFKYYELHDLRSLAEMTRSDNALQARLAWRTIKLLSEDFGPAHRLHIFQIADLASRNPTNERLNLLDRLAGCLAIAATFGKEAGPYRTTVARTLDLLYHSRLNAQIEEDLAYLLTKMLDPSTYPPESSRSKDERGNVLAKSSDIRELVPLLLDAMLVMTVTPGSLPARLASLAADRGVQVNGAFITVATLALRQAIKGGTLATYYGEPLFMPGVRAKLTDLHFSPDNVDAVDAFLEHEVFDARRGGGGIPGRGPMFYAMPLGMSAVNMAGARMFTGVPMSTMPLALLNLGL